MLRPLLAGGLLIAALSFAFFYLSAQEELGNEMMRAHSVLRSTMELLDPYLAGVLLIAYLLFVLLLIWWSRHVAGPMLRLRRSLETLADGHELPPIELRRGDSGAELAGTVNRIAGVLEEKRRGDVALLLEAERLASLATKGEVEAGLALRRLVGRLTGKPE